MANLIRSVFRGGKAGNWCVRDLRAITGEGLPAVARLDVSPEGSAVTWDPTWTLRGSTGHVRYVERGEQQDLAKVTPPLDRPAAIYGAFIPIRKADAWWDLPQDERRAILESRSQHIAIGLRYLPAVARRLYHARELGEPFDFLTWFEFAPTDEARFDDLLGALRASEEWAYVEREVELRLQR